MATSIEVGAELYEAVIRFTRVTEYGVGMSEITAGGAPPAQGARFDVHFEGSFVGDRLRGRISGVDYIHVRADGRFDLHIHAQLLTAEGVSIAFFADGVATPQAGTAIAQLRENVTFHSAAPDYAWLNTLQAWGRGTVDLEKGEVRVRVYAA